MSRRAIARTVPFSIGISYDFPVRLSVTLRECLPCGRSLVATWLEAVSFAFVFCVSAERGMRAASGSWVSGLGYFKIAPGATEINMRRRSARGSRHAPAQRFDQVSHVARQGRLERDLPARDRVDEAQGAGVQGGPADEGRASAVAAVTDEGVARLGEVDADLIPAAGAQADGQQRGIGEALGHRVLGDRLLPLPRAAGRAHLESPPVLDETALQAALVRPDRACGDRDVQALDGAGLELGLERLEGAPRTGEEQKAARVPVEPVQGVERRAADAALALGFEEPLHQAVLFLAQGRRDAQETRRLLDDQQVAILVDDLVSGAGPRRRLRTVAAAGLDPHLVALADRHAVGVLPGPDHGRRTAGAATQRPPDRPGVNEPLRLPVGKPASIVQDGRQRAARIAG